MEWKWKLQLSDTLLRFQFGASLFSSAAQAQLTQLAQLVASHSDQGERANDIRALSRPKPGEPGYGAAWALSSLQSSMASLGGPHTGEGWYISTAISSV